VTGWFNPYYERLRGTVEVEDTCVKARLDIVSELRGKRLTSRYNEKEVKF